MKKNCAIIFLMFIGGTILPQQSNDFFCKKSSRIYLVGSEPYQNKITFSVNYSILQELYSHEIYPKFIMLEFGHGTAFVLNRYLESGNKELLSQLFEFDTITRNYFVKLRELSLSLADNRKFSFIGVSYDHDDDATYLALRYLLLSQKEFADNTECTTGLKYISNAQRFDHLICSFIDQRLNAEKTKENIDLMIELLHSADSVKVIKKLGARYAEAKMVLNSYQLSKKRENRMIYYVPGDGEFQQQREKHVLESIYQVFSKDTSVFIFGSFTSYSKLFMGKLNAKDTTVFNTFANSLNYDSKYSLTNNKICANVIIYKNNIKKQSKDYGLNRDELNNEFKSLQSNKLLIKPYTGKYPMINQILFYNLKQVNK